MCNFLSIIVCALALSFSSANAQSFNLFGTVTPHNPDITSDGSAVTLGVKFQANQPGTVSGIRFYRAHRSSSSGYTVKLFSVTGTRIAQATTKTDTCAIPCWEQVNFASPISIAANTTYVAAYYTTNGNYADDEYVSGGLTNAVTNGPLTAMASTASGGNGVYAYSTGFPNASWHDSNYYVDVSFTPSAPSLQMVFNPPSPSIPSDTPPGSTVSTAMVTWSNGSPFTGTLGFVAPYGNDNGMFAFSGYDIVVAGTGLGSSGNTTQNITVQAVQGTTSTAPQNLSIKVTALQTPVGVSFSPQGPVNVVDSSASGTNVAAVQVSTSDGNAFSGTLSITTQTTNGMVSLSGSNIIVANINAADDGAETVTVQACENGSCASGTLGMNVVPAVVSSGLLPPDRDASANWKMAGMQSVGGIPVRSTICATLSPLGGGRDDTPNINTAITNCPVGQIVSLVAGTFTINEGSIVQLYKAVTLRGAGPSATFLTRTNGAQLGSYFPGSNQSELIRISGNSATGSTVALTVDAAQGANSVQVSNATGYSVGEIVLLDELSGSGWQPDRVQPNTGQIWASPDYRVVWNVHNPSMGGDDGFPDILSYFQIHSDHPTNEMHQISAISGNTITFDSPVTISYRVSHKAQLTPMLVGPTNAGVEELAVKGGDNGNIRFEGAAYAWAKNIDSSLWLNEGFAIDQSFRVQLEGIYIHDAVWPSPGGGGYAISFADASSEDLIENSISMRANKVMVARSSGTGSVIGYNYVDDGFIYGSDGWVEIGLNASHLVGSHHVLFEGNYGFNIDSDQTHGNSIYHTFFRNYASGYRRAFTDYLNNVLIDDVNNKPGGNGPLRAGAAHAYAYWFSFIGNVLGTAGHTSGWTYNCISSQNSIPGNCIWELGWVDISPQGYDPNTVATALQDGNYDYLTNTIKWASSDTAHTLPNSLYMSVKPGFFSGGASTWPWVNPTGSPQLYTLPAKARYDAGTPFTQP